MRRLHPLLRLRSFSQVLRHFKNPFFILLLRLGIVEVPYFLYRIGKDNRRYSMLARPTSTFMADIFVLREVFIEEAYRDVLPLLNKKNIRLVDIGANIGSFTIWLNSIIGLREAFCFEPEADSFRLLIFNLSLNICTTVKAIQSAVGGEERKIRIALKQDSPGGTSIYGSCKVANVSAQRVPVIAFEKWLHDVAGDFDLLKMDCEGAEWEIFRKTSTEQFARFRVFVAEVHDDPEKSQAVSEFKGLAERAGFQTVRWDNKSQGLYIGVRVGKARL